MELYAVQNHTTKHIWRIRAARYIRSEALQSQLTRLATERATTSVRSDVKRPHPFHFIAITFQYGAARLPTSSLRLSY
jgi:hypothetical protein